MIKYRFFGKTSFLGRLFFAILVLPFVFTACSEFTDIKPKGESTLDKVEDLELLLNCYTLFSKDFEEYRYLINDIMPSEKVNVMIDEHRAGRPSQNSVLVMWDETVDRVTQTTNKPNGFNAYDSFYEIICRVTNPIIDRVDQANGDPRKGAQIKAEAYVLRAYYHYLLVNFYAKAYHAATAATDGGVPYMTEDVDIYRPTTKETVQKVYDKILADLNAAIELDALPETPLIMRVGKPFAYAVKAEVLMSLGRYDEAEKAADTVLAINSTILDHRNDVRPNAASIPYFFRPKYNGEDLFALYVPKQGMVLSEDMLASLEAFDMLKKYGPLEFNIRPPYTYQMNNGPNTTNLLNVQSIFVDFMAGLGATEYGLFYNRMGLTTVDMYLIKAECAIRNGDISPAVDILDDLRERRTENGQFTPLGITGKPDAIAALKRVSRNENFLTYKNFINLKRWNTETEWETTLQKTLKYVPGGFLQEVENAPWEPNGSTEQETFELRPGSPLWIFPFPPTATDYNPNLTQNY